MCMGKDINGKELGVGLTQRKDGRYSAKYITAQGKRKEKYFLKLKDARNWLDEQRYLTKVSGSSNMLVDDWYEYWYKNFKEKFLADNTLKGYRIRYEKNIKSEIGRMKLSDIKQYHCQEIINKMFDSGKYSYGTMELTQITMHAIFKVAVENDLMTKNPAENLSLVNRDEDDDERRVLTREEQKIFIKYSEKTQYHNAYCLVLETGMRAGEIGALKWTDIDFDKRCININHTLLQKKGGFYLGKPKSKKSKRQIPLTNKAVDILKRQKQDQELMKKKSSDWSKEWESLVFTTKNGNPVGQSTFRTCIIRIVKNINADRKYSSTNGFYEVFEHTYMHSLRHTFATRCVENNMNFKTLQIIMGHSTLSTTMDLYAHVTEDNRFDEIEKMNIPI